MGLTKLGGTVDRRYRLDRIIAYGGMATVFEAEHLVTHRRVVLKRPLPQFEHDEEIHKRLLREARALGVVRHPNVVDVLDAGRDEDGAPYVAMELLQGKTLEGILAARGPLSASTVARIGVSLCEALATAHRRGVVHRDVKPGNVFAVSHGGVEVLKLFDFGTAAIRGEPLTGADGEPLSKCGVLGTIEYVAPELLADGSEADEQSDVYSLGVTLFECLSGDVPFEGHVARVMHQVMTKAPPSLRVLCPEVPAALADVVDRALARDRLYRFRSVSDMRRALLAAVPEPFPSAPPTLRPGLGSLGPPPMGDSSAPPSSEAPESLVSDAEPTIQRRRHRRVHYIMPVALRTEDGAILEGRSEDLSESGLRVLLFVRPRAGDAVTVRFALPGSGELVEVAAVTRWSRASRGLGAIGLEFTKLDRRVRRRIREFVEVHRALTAVPWSGG